MDLERKKSALIEVLSKRRADLLPVLPFDFTDQSALVCLDFSGANQTIAALDLSSSAALGRYIWSEIAAKGAAFGIGGYGEDRIWYRRSPHFAAGEEIRSIHLGIDIWCQAGTKVSAPLAGTVHSFKDNNNFGDYGPTVILEHELEAIRFFTLYGHLSRRSLDRLRIGSSIRAGEIFAELGTEEENGDWPPHLHLQLILDLGGMAGDFPGVAAPSTAECYLTLCPDPKLLLPGPTE